MVCVNAMFVAPGGHVSLMTNHHGGFIVPSSISQNVGALNATDVAVVLEVMGTDSRMVRVLGPSGSGWIGSAMLKMVKT